MTGNQRPKDDMLRALQERAKELQCLYQVDELLHQSEPSTPEILGGVVRALPPAWQYPAICRARILVGGATYESDGFVVTRRFREDDRARLELVRRLGTRRGRAALAMMPSA